jgi:hypothetical protein
LGLSISVTVIPSLSQTTDYSPAFYKTSSASAKAYCRKLACVEESDSTKLLAFCQISFAN